MNFEIKGVWEKTLSPDLRARGLHSHENYEIFYLVSGETDYLVEGSCYPMRAGDLILMRKGEVHIPRLLKSEPYERLHVNFDLDLFLKENNMEGLMDVFLRRPLGKLNHYSAALFPENGWGNWMRKICSSEDRGVRLSFLLTLLCDLGEAFPVLSRGREANSGDAHPILEYVNAHLGDDISLSSLTERFYISKTHLNRIFRSATGTTVWKYITIKRLFLAKEALADGVRPTEVYRRCGFQDYTTFFRAYKKQFGVSPTNREGKET